MKKIIVLLLLSCLCVFSACKPVIDGGGGLLPGDLQNGSGNDESRLLIEEQITKEINSNSTFEFKFLEDVADKDFSDFVHIPGFGCDDYYNKKYGDYGDDFFQKIYDGELTNYVYYQVSAYPDEADGGSFITLIVCADPEVTFFNGCTIDDAHALFEYLSSLGYEIIYPDEHRLFDYRIEAENIIINWTVGEKISFGYSVTNRTGIIY